MFKFLRTLAQPSFRLPPSLLRYNGQVNVQRVRFVRPFFTKKRAQKLYIGAALTGLFLLAIEVSVDADEEQRDTGVTARKTAGSLVETVGNKFHKTVQPPRDGGTTEKNKGGFKPEQESQGESGGGHGGGGEDQADAQDENDENEEEYEYEDDEDDDDEDEEELAEEDRGEEGPAPEAIPEDALFIPLGLVRERRRAFYKGSDPEWQSFLEFSRDKKRSTQIRHELVGLVGYYVANLRNVQKFLGMPIITRKYWLDIDFPDGPPPEYERRGLEITDDYVALTVRPVSAEQYSRLQTMLWPTSMAASLWASYSLLWSLRWAKLKDSLNINSPQENPNSKASPSFFDFRRIANDNQKSQSDPAVNQLSETAPSKELSAGERSKSLSSSTPSNSSNALPPLPSLPDPGKDMSIAFKTFKRTLAKTWKSPSIPPERGTFIVSGLIEVEGSKAICVLDVRAAYHPKESRWVAIGVSVRRMQSRKQIPKGGI